MRISDLSLFNNFLSNINDSRKTLSKLQSQLTTLKKIEKPSDSPSGVGKLIRYNNQFDFSTGYVKNIDESLAFINISVDAMQAMQTQITNVMTSLVKLNNPTIGTDLQSFSDNIDAALESIKNSANQKFNGKFLFGGTNYTTKPLDFNTNHSSIEIKSNSIAGVQNVQIAQNITQKINITGNELFGTEVTQSGNLDATKANGTVNSKQTIIYDAKENQFSFIANYTKTADNTYDFTYDIKDSNGNSVLPAEPTAKKIIFEPATGDIKSIDGKPPASFLISVSSKDIQFNFNIQNVIENTSTSNLSFSANQKVDIFNTLLTIKDKLHNGQLPTDEEVQRVNNFNSHILDKIASTGTIVNKLDNAKSILHNQQTTLNRLVSNLQDVDVAKASMELQNQQSLLAYSYKISSMVLPKSLMDFL